MRLLTLAILGLGLTALPAWSQEAASAQEKLIQAPLSLEAFLSIPQPMREILVSNSNAHIYRENFIAQAVSVIRINASDNKTLTITDLNNAQNSQALKIKEQLRSKFVEFDENLDGKISESELDEGLGRSKSMEDSLRNSRRYPALQALDKNRDGNITFEEFSQDGQKASSSLNRGQLLIQSYLNLDPNHDNKLTAFELQKLAEQTFDSIDGDADGVINHGQLQNIKQFTSFSQQLGCNIPRLEKPGSLVAFNLLKGEKTPNYSVAGQSEKTTAVDVEISDEPGNISLFLSNASPIIYRFTGKTSRIDALIVAGPVRDATTVRSGVIGIDPDKIRFIDNNCLPPAPVLDESALGIEKMKLYFTVVQYIAQSEKIRMGHANSATKITVNNTEPPEAENKNGFESDLAAPPEFEELGWKRFIASSPGGLIDLKNEKIVSPTTPERYEVLPEWAGMAQLLKDGAIVRDMSSMSPNTALTPNMIHLARYKIIKAIPYYPSGLFGGDATRFLLGKGVPAPQGNSGHSCVISEETGKPIQYATYCD